LAAFSSLPVFKIGTMGGMVRYYIGTSSNVAVDVLDAHGRVVKSITSAMQTAGWHSIQLSGALTGGSVTSNGVYFVRCAVDGKSMSVKRILFIR
jgi:flagellar hook assembly protein FlgD